jgi:hypothetical protein
MGVRTRGLDIAINAKRQVADAAARAEAKGVVERWNEQVGASRALASVATLVLGLRCSWCPGSAPMPRISSDCIRCLLRRSLRRRTCDRRPARSRADGLMSCLIVDHPNVLSQNLKADPIKAPNLSHAYGSAG